MGTIKEIQEWLKEQDIIASDTLILNTAMDIARRIGPGDYSFLCELKKELLTKKEIKLGEK